MYEVDRTTAPSAQIPFGSRRICYLAHFTAGGSAISLQTLVDHLDRERYVPTVIFHRVKSPSLVAKMEARDIPVIDLVPPRPRTAAPAPLKMNLTARLGQEGLRGRLLRAYRAIRAAGQAFVRDVRWIPALARHLRRIRPQLVHCNNGLRAHRLDLLLCAGLGIPVVCHVRNFETLTPLERLAARTVRHFIYISNAVASRYQEQGIPAQKGVVIPNAVPVTAYQSCAPVPRAEFGWGPEHWVVANVGRLVSWKGQDVFLQAIARLASRLPQLRALVVGAPDDNLASRAFAEELHRQVAALGIADRVVFAGHRTDVMGLMAMADVVVHSAVTPEPFGRVVIEAMAAGRPVVAARDGGVLDVVSHEDTGLLVQPGQADDLAATLERLATEPALAGRLAEAAQGYAASHFSAAQHAARVMALYEACLPQGEQAAVAESSQPPATLPATASEFTSSSRGDGP